MVLRNMALVGGHQRRVEMPVQHRATFEEGAVLIFARWTALQLGVQNEWGGPKSAEKAQELLQDVIGWFYNTKGAHAHGHVQPTLEAAAAVAASGGRQSRQPATMECCMLPCRTRNLRPSRPLG